MYNLSINFKWLDTMIQQQQSMILSPYSGFYDIKVPKDNPKKNFEANELRIWIK
jgi:hypothetical protein